MKELKCKDKKNTKNDISMKLIDTIDIIVHIFHPEKRKFYDLEKMWYDPTDKKEIS